jgi:hypothetical protein
MLAVMAVVILANCGGKKGPEAVAEKFLRHLHDKEYDEAKKYGTAEFQETIDAFQQFGYPYEEKGVAITDIKCTEEEEKATCTFKKEGVETESVVYLIKDGEEWKVNDLPKESPTDDMSFDEDFDFEDEEMLEEEVGEEVVEEVVE